MAVDDDPIRARYPDELSPEAHEPAQLFYEVGPRAGQAPEGSTKVGWTVRDGSNKIVRGFSFLINPQGITRTHGSRSQLTATKGGFYTDDFGPAPNQIQLRQIVGAGKVVSGRIYTAREDVQRFIKEIWLPATAGPGSQKLRVFFHDHHFERGFEERVHFPPNSLTIQRSVDLHNLWLMELQMVSLEKYPYREIVTETALNPAANVKRYRVKGGDTLGKIVSRVAGKKASKKKRAQVQARILELNPRIRKRRVFPSGRVGQPMRVYPGEVLVIPA